MKADDPAVLDVMRRSMVARIATFSRNGRPSITPLYFVSLWQTTRIAQRMLRLSPTTPLALNVLKRPAIDAGSSR